MNQLTFKITFKIACATALLTASLGAVCARAADATYGDSPDHLPAINNPSQPDTGLSEKLIADFRQELAAHFRYPSDDLPDLAPAAVNAAHNFAGETANRAHDDIGTALGDFAGHGGGHGVNINLETPHHVPGQITLGSVLEYWPSEAIAEHAVHSTFGILIPF